MLGTLPTGCPSLALFGVRARPSIRIDVADGCHHQGILLAQRDIRKQTRVYLLNHDY